MYVYVHVCMDTCRSIEKRESIHRTARAHTRKYKYVCIYVYIHFTCTHTCSVDAYIHLQVLCERGTQSISRLFPPAVSALHLFLPRARHLAAIFSDQFAYM